MTRASSKMSSSRSITVFKTFPKELFRVNNGHRVQLRPWSPNRSTYDIVTDDKEVVKPKALDPLGYIGEFLQALRLY